MARTKRARKQTMMGLLTDTPHPTLPATIFKAKCAEVLDAVHALRRPVVITKHGKPLAKVVPTGVEPLSPIGFLDGSVISSPDLVAADPGAWAEVPDPRAAGW